MAFPTLALVSPHRHGERVKEAQYLLRNNRFKQVFLKQNIDGDYGPETGAAAHQAKYWTGYPDNEIDTRFGSKLRSYLVPLDHVDAQKLPAANLRRRAARLKKAAQAPLRLKVLELALKEVGYAETGNNDTKFGREYSMNNQPWCAIFCSIMVKHAMTWYERLRRKFLTKFWYSYVPSVVSDARQSRNGISVTTAPQPGHFVCFDWQHDGTGDHIGIFGGWIKEGSTFWTVEGNTSPDDGGNQSNGGGCYRRNRNVSQVEAFIAY